MQYALYKSPKINYIYHNYMFFTECYSWLYTEYLLQGLMRKHMCCSPLFCCVLIALELQHFHLCTFTRLFVCV